WKWVDTHEKELGIGRPYLDRDAPHVGPIGGKEYAAHRAAQPNTQEAESKVGKQQQAVALHPDRRALKLQQVALHADHGASKREQVALHADHGPSKRQQVALRADHGASKRTKAAKPSRAQSRSQTRST